MVPGDPWFRLVLPCCWGNILLTNYPMPVNCMIFFSLIHGNTGASLMAQRQRICLQGKRLPANTRDSGSIPGSERSPRGGNGNPLQSSCLGNLMDRGTWWATVHGVAGVRQDLLLPVLSGHFCPLRASSHARIGHHSALLSRGTFGHCSSLQLLIYVSFLFLGP